MPDKSRNIEGRRVPPPEKKIKKRSTEESLFVGKILQIFFPDEEIFGLTKEKESQKRISYTPEFGRSKIAHFYADYFLIFKNIKISYEYNGPVHYTAVDKIARDRRKNIVMKDQGINVHNIPYYLNSFTKDIAKYYFNPYKVYSDDKYKKVLNDLFEVDNESELLGPGWHTTNDTPANFVNKGLEKFFDELKDFPPSLKCQLVHSLNLYKKAYDGKKDWLVQPIGHDAFDKFMSHKPDPANINYYYTLDF